MVSKIAAGIRAKADFFAEIIMEEQGKTRGLATVEANFVPDYMDYMAGFARHIEGEVIESDAPNENIILYKEPIGVAAGILPWNFPSSWSRAKWLRAGCRQHHRDQAVFRHA